VGQTMEEYRESIRPQAEIMAKRNLIISEIYRQEGISINDTEIDERIDRMLGIQPGTAEAGGEAMAEEQTEGEEAEGESLVEAHADEAEAHDHDLDHEQEHLEHEHEHHEHDHDHNHSQGEPASNADTMRALRDMMKSGSGRAVLESQILQEHSIERLLAIARGEEVPDRPAPKEEAAPVAEGTPVAEISEEPASEEASADEAAA